MRIIGAGMSGLLAGQYFRSQSPVLYEKQKELPNNHKALLRFRSEAVSDLTGIKFQKVRVSKMINYQGDHYTESNLYFNNLYSMKVTGGIYPRSAINLSSAERFIAPEDFVDQVSRGLCTKFDADGDDVIRTQLMLDNPRPLISTIPIDALAILIGYDIKEDLQTREIWTATFILGMDIDVYQTVYYPNPAIPLYRMSITGDKVIAEFCRNPKEEWGDKASANIQHFLEIDFAVKPDDYVINVPKAHYQEYGKIVPCDRTEVKKFMGWASRKYNIYSLGRWATHRQILMDDVVHDLKIIGNLIDSEGYRR